MKINLDKIKKAIDEKGKSNVSVNDEIAFYLLKNGFRKVSHFTYIYEFNISGRTISYISVDLKDRKNYVINHDGKEIKSRGDINNIICDMEKILEGNDYDSSDV